MAISIRRKVPNKGALMSYEIHPAIGMARLGSTDADTSEFYFFGPEPGCSANDYSDARYEHDPAQAPVRYESDGKTVLREYRRGDALKRQGVRFRIFDCERHSDGTLISSVEINYDDFEIEWTVHIANRKAAGYRFADRNKADKERRNERDPDGKALAVEDLVINPGLRTLSGRKSAIAATGRFMKMRDIELAQLKTDEKGRLLIIGPRGASGSPCDSQLDDFADNDHWYDNTSDGPVLAKLWQKNRDGTRTLQTVANAWVIVAPFDFVPELDSFVTLHDICLQAWCDKIERPLPAPGATYYETDVLNLLNRVRNYRWVNGPTIRAETQDRHVSWRSETTASKLGDPADETGSHYRKMLLAHIPDPDAEDEGKRQVLMPRLHADEPYVVTPDGELDVHATARKVLHLTRVQYAHLRNWANDDFKKGPDPQYECLAAALDRIALQACSGGAFYPGMEVPRIVREPLLYDSAPFRLRPRLDPHGNPQNPASHGPEASIDDGLLPGQLTEGLAVPWQADFWACQMERDNAWWPATRPDHVFIAQPARPADSQSEEVYRWDEGLSGYRDMVEHWHQLGIVRKKMFNVSPPPTGPDKKYDPRVTAEVDANGAYYYFAEEGRSTELPHRLPSSGHHSAPGHDH
jgi:hypothetical protein